MSLKKTCFPLRFKAPDLSGRDTGMATGPGLEMQEAAVGVFIAASNGDGLRGIPDREQWTLLVGFCRYWLCKHRA